MSSLLDIAPAIETVTVRGVAIDVHGISAKGVAALMGRFPNLTEMMGGKEIDVAMLMSMSGDIIAAIIAAGTGHPGEVKHEEAAGRLPIDAQADLLAAILRVTLPDGINPFVAKLTSLGSLLNLSAATEPAIPNGIAHVTEPQPSLPLPLNS